MYRIPPVGVGKEVLYEKRADHIAIVTLNRPSVRNAVNGVIARALDHIVKDSEADSEVRCVILASSHERVFCAGADLVEISRGNTDALVTADGGFAGFVDASREKPWIAAVNGSAFAGGFELVLACDMLVASQNSRFGLPEVKRGLFAGAAGPYRLPRTLPRNIALEMVATGDPLNAERGFALGLINKLVADVEVMSAALALAEVIAANAPLSVRESLKVARRAFDLSEDDLQDLSKATTALVFASEDAREGPAAFLEKRPPVWMGR